MPITYCCGCAGLKTGRQETPRGSAMCLLCEELWMPFEPPQQTTARTFVADAPEPDAEAAPDTAAAPPVPDPSGGTGRP
jgi:hypothetical protein